MFKSKAPIRIELMNEGFADLSLTTWARRQKHSYYIKKQYFMQVGFRHL